VELQKLETPIPSELRWKKFLWAVLPCASIVAVANLVATSAAFGEKTLSKQTISGADGAAITISLTPADLQIEYRAPGLDDSSAIFVALGTHHEIGSAVVPFRREQEGSTVFLPFKADLLVFLKFGEPAACRERKWTHWKWNEATISATNHAKIDRGTAVFQLPLAQFTNAATTDCAVYAKDLRENNGWGKLFGCSDPEVEAKTGDQYIPQYLELNLAANARPIATVRSRYNIAGSKLRIYQLFVRLFGNTNETRKEDGTITENGVGKFIDINDAALKALRDSGFTLIWLTGVLQQATATDYSNVGQPADDPDLLKGLAGSPYAIKDYFDVCPDYAEKPDQRLSEFKALLERIHKYHMRALLDFVPNHVARSYNSDIKPDQNFGTKGNSGAGDDTSVFFSPQNNFFYLTPDAMGPPLRLPTWKDGQPISPTCKVVAALAQGAAVSPAAAGPGSETSAASAAADKVQPPLRECDGLFDGEKDHGKVTGNNKPSWLPDINDWYETAKLNYGFDFTDPTKSVREYPNANTPDKPVPDTWKKMDGVLAYWQAIGVDGFRCDMSHMVPPEFWNWIIHRARARHPYVVFIGEAYDNDPAKVPGVDPVISKLHGGQSNVMFDLLDAGFNAVYDDPTYRAIKKIYEGPGWANDIDAARPYDFIFENSLRYSENHDEVRLAAKSQWGGLGMKVGVPVSAILYGLSRGPIMLYNGQEVGEPGEGVEGFGGNDARTSIFDYWSMPEFVKWVNDHKYDGKPLSPEQRELRSFYSRLVNLVSEPAFRDGICIALNGANRDNPGYGRLANEQPSGHWLYSFLRYDLSTGQRFLIVVNLNPTHALKDIRIILPQSVVKSLGLDTQPRNSALQLIDRLAAKDGITANSTVQDASEHGILISEIPPLTPCYFELKVE
jgi:glycosidase